MIHVVDDDNAACTRCRDLQRSGARELLRMMAMVDDLISSSVMSVLGTHPSRFTSTRALPCGDTSRSQVSIDPRGLTEQQRPHIASTLHLAMQKWASMRCDDGCHSLTTTTKGKPTSILLIISLITSWTSEGHFIMMVFAIHLKPPISEAFTFELIA
eukprot:jgi/Bigna1/65396/fgenesh1_kg.108_\